MCVYPDVLGEGAVLEAQALVLIAVLASILFWIWMYRRMGVGLRGYAIPIILWVAFGTLDILITTRGTFGNPYLEGNPLAESIFVLGGSAGPVIASILWIALWSGLVLLINRRFAGKKNTGTERAAASFVSLAVFYSLAAGYILGFSSWFIPLCSVAASLAPMITSHFMAAVVIGSCAAALHAFMKELLPG